MGLAAEDIKQIEQLIEKKIRELPQNTNISYELEIRERIVRVEEELKHQRELIYEGFKQTDKRFEQVDKRFEQMQLNMDKRFEQVDKRFEQVDKRFEQIQLNMDKRFEQVDKRFEAMQNTLKWGLGVLIAIAGLIAAILRLLV